MLHEKNIIFLGAGSMAEAMISGMIGARKIPIDQISVSNQSNTNRLNHLKKTYGINTIVKEKLNITHYDIIILAMKPKDAEIALQSIQNIIQPHQLILSVMAGIKTSFFERNLPSGQQVIRIMPNTSSMVGESATAISTGKYTSKQNLDICRELLQCIGKVFVITEEKMDIFTGIAGSGPAYIYYLMEQMELEAENSGLSREISRKIIAQTLLGAAKMIQDRDETPSTLRKKVTSPNGTTEAGLEALKMHGGGAAIAQAIKQATSRSKAISEELEKLLT